MAEIKRRVYSPRGDRGGGGLVAQVTIDEEDVQRWLGPVGSPSALDRVSVQRQVSGALTLLLREVSAWLAQREVDRARRALLDEAGGSEEGAEAVPPGVVETVAPTSAG